jgi:replicative DNA helicase
MCEDVCRSIFGAMFWAPEKFGEVAGVLRADLFPPGLFQDAIEKAHELHAEGISPTQGNLSASFPEGSDLLLIPAAYGDLRFLAKRLAESRMVAIWDRFAAEVGKDADPFKKIKAVEEALNECNGIIGLHSRPDKGRLLDEYIQYLSESASGSVQRIPTPLPTLTWMLQGGFRPGDLSFLGGLPGSGKTSLMLLLAIHAAKQGTKVSIIEGEMPSSEIHERLHGILSGEDISLIRRGQSGMSGVDFAGKLYGLPLNVVPMRDRTLDVLLSRLRDEISRGAQFLAVDYLQVFTPKGKHDDEFSQIKKLSEALRQLALANGVHILVLSSLNRNELGASRLTLGSLYGSSQLGHDCSVAMLLGAAVDDAEEMRSTSRRVKLTIAKNRSGARGDVPLHYDLASQRFAEEVGADPGIGFTQKVEEVGHGF